MPGFNFRVALDLTSIFEDKRSRCYIYVDVSKLRKIEDLERHIRSQFRIIDDIYISTNGYYIPSTESIEILQTNEILKVSRNESSRPDEEFENRVNEISNGYANKTWKIAATPSSWDHLWAVPSVSSCGGLNSAKIPGPKRNSDSGVEVEDELKCLPKSERKKKNKNKAHSLSEFEQTDKLDTSLDSKCMQRKKPVISELEDNKNTVDSVDTRFSKRASKRSLSNEPNRPVNDIRENAKPRKKQKHITVVEADTAACKDQSELERFETKTIDGSSQESSISMPCSSNVQFVLQHSTRKPKKDDCVPPFDDVCAKETQEICFTETQMETEEGLSCNVKNMKARNSNVQFIVQHSEQKSEKDNGVPQYDSVFAKETQDICCMDTQIETEEKLSHDVEIVKETKEAQQYCVDNLKEIDEKLANIIDDIKETASDEECSIIESDGMELKKPRRRRTRTRKRKNRVKGFDPIVPLLNMQTLTGHSTPRESNSSSKHIRFASDNEEDSESSATENARISCSLPVISNDEKPTIRSLSKWDQKPPEMSVDHLSTQQSSSALTLDEVLSKTVPILKRNSAALVFDCTKTENIKSESNPELEVVYENKVESKLDIMRSSSPLKGQPRKDDFIAFKVFRLSEEYTPGLSNYITARVLSYDSNTYNLRLQIIDGHQELRQPQGRFSLQEEKPVTMQELVELNWNEVIEPRLIFP